MLRRTRAWLLEYKLPKMGKTLYFGSRGTDDRTLSSVLLGSERRHRPQKTMACATISGLLRRREPATSPRPPRPSLALIPAGPDPEDPPEDRPTHLQARERAYQADRAYRHN